jgi:hypothetical protein
MHSPLQRRGPGRLRLAAAGLMLLAVLGLGTGAVLFHGLRGLQEQADAGETRSNRLR